jgi:hypothetical protein
MKILARIRDALSFTPGPTTLVAVLVYAAIFTSVLVTDELPNVPKQKKWKGLNFTRAYEDLHIVRITNMRILYLVSFSTFFFCRLLLAPILLSFARMTTYATTFSHALTK